MRIPLLIAFLIVIAMHAQSQLKPIISANYSYFHSRQDLRSHEVQIGGGVQFNDHLFLQLNLRSIQNASDRINYFPEIDPFRSVILSLSPSYRVLKDTFFVSPLIVLDVGTEIWSNAKGRIIDDNYFIRPKSYGGDVHYNRGLFFCKAKLLLDIKLKSFDILLGGSYNLYTIRVNELLPYYYSVNSNDPVLCADDVQFENGFGVEAGLIYTFHSSLKERSKPKKNRHANATIGTGYSNLLDEGTNFWFHNNELGFGIRIRDHYFIDMNFGRMINRYRPNPRVNFITHSIGFSYRMLDSTKTISPLLGVFAGYAPFSNGGFQLDEQYKYEDFLPTYYTVQLTSFFRTKLMLDVQYKNVNFRIGGVYNYQKLAVSTMEFSPQEGFFFPESTKKMHGWGAEVGMVFTLRKLMKEE